MSSASTTTASNPPTALLDRLRNLLQYPVQSAFTIAALNIGAAAYSYQRLRAEFFPCLLLLTIGLVLTVFGLWRARNNQPKTPTNIQLALWLTAIALPLARTAYVILYFLIATDRKIEFNLLPVLFFLFVAGLIALFLRKQKSAHSTATRTPFLHWTLYLAFLIHIAVAVNLIRTHPGQIIDVFNFEQDATKALLHGINPYSISHINVYTPEQSVQFYAPGITENGIIHWGYPYMPLTLFYFIPGSLLGDIRYSQLLAILITAFVTTRIRPGRYTNILACLLLLSPLSFFMEQFAWNETLALLNLTLALYAAIHRRWWLPIALGFFFVTKQYCPLVLPFFFFLAPDDFKSRLKLLLQSGCAALLITAPLALLNLKLFWTDVVVYLSQQKPHLDSIAYIIYFQTPTVVYALLLLLAIAFALLRAPRSPAYFAASSALFFLVFFLFSKQAFMNYYFLISHALLLAVAAIPTHSTNTATPANSANSAA